jgi:hypothetical protein
MRRPACRPIAIASVMLATMLVLAGALPVAAKEDMQARLDAPIGGATPGGTTLIVGLMVTVAGTETRDPVEGSPIYLVLRGPGGSSRAALIDLGPKRGHYTMRVTVPEGGVTAIEVGLAGSSDLPIEVVGTWLVAGGVTPDTAQVAPAEAPAPAPAGAGTAPVPAPVAVAPQPALAPAAPAQAPVTPAPLPLLLGGVLALVLAAVILAMAVRGSRARARPLAPDGRR